MFCTASDNPLHCAKDTEGYFTSKAKMLAHLSQVEGVPSDGCNALHVTKNDGDNLQLSQELHTDEEAHNRTCIF